MPTTLLIALRIVIISEPGRHSSKPLLDALYAMAPRAHMFEFNYFLSQDQSLMWASLVHSGEELLDSLLEKGRNEDKVLVNGSMLPPCLLISQDTSTTIALHRPRPWRYCDQTRSPPIAPLDFVFKGPAPNIE